MKTVFAITMTVLVFGIVGQGDFEEAQREHRHYCAMVDSWKRNGGTTGHPNYENRQCSNRSEGFRDIR